MIDVCSALHIHVENEENGKHAAGHHPSECWKGGRGAAGLVHLSLQGTNEADCQKVLGLNDDIRKREALPRESSPKG